MSATAPLNDTKRESTMSDADAKFLVEFVDRRIGVQLAGKEYLIESRLTPICRDLGLADLTQLMSRVRAQDRVAEQRVLDAVTTNETSFFRDNHPFENLARIVIPDILSKSGRQLTVWNAACSSGQESYTFAISMFENHPAVANPGRLKIIATDVSTEMVDRTRSGEYTKFEVNRGLPSDQALKYFDQQGRKWVAKKNLRDLVDAQVLNLLDPWPAVPKCDIVMVRNVLIYFTADVKRRILERIHREILAPHGVLVLGSTEKLVGLNAPFEPRQVGTSTFYFPTGKS